MSTRIERDTVGELQIDPEAYYGVQSKRAEHNFQITGQLMRSEMIKSLAQIKKASALANEAAGRIPSDKIKAIIQACDEIIEGKLHDQFICDPVQGGAGTSANMNANEVIANRAEEILGGTKGDYKLVHPNDHVNLSQSTNDVFPTAGKLTVITLIKEMLPKLEALAKALRAKGEEAGDLIRVGQTQLQDALPMYMKEVFFAYASALERDIEHIKEMEKYMYINNMGATAIGSGANGNKDYMNTINKYLSDVTGFPMETADNLFDGTQNLDGFTIISGALRAAAVSLSKMSNDLRLLSSGPRTGRREIQLPPRQNGSSIMPGKVNPVIPEVVSQVAYLVIGNDTTITMCAEGGQLQLNAFEPVLFYKLFESIYALGQAAETLRVNCVEGIIYNKEIVQESLENSLVMVTALCPVMGYTKAADLAKKAMRENKSLREVVLAETDIKEAELDEILDPVKLATPPNA